MQKMLVVWQQNTKISRNVSWRLLYYVLSYAPHSQTMFA